MGKFSLISAICTSTYCASPSKYLSTLRFKKIPANSLLPDVFQNYHVKTDCKHFSNFRFRKHLKTCKVEVWWNKMNRTQKLSLLSEDVVMRMLFIFGFKLTECHQQTTQPFETNKFHSSRVLAKLSIHTNTIHKINARDLELGLSELITPDKVALSSN